MKPLSSQRTGVTQETCRRADMDYSTKPDQTGFSWSSTGVHPLPFMNCNDERLLWAKIKQWLEHPRAQSTRVGSTQLDINGATIRRTLTCCSGRLTWALMHLRSVIPLVLTVRLPSLDLYYSWRHNKTKYINNALFQFHNVVYKVHSNVDLVDEELLMVLWAEWLSVRVSTRTKDVQVCCWSRPQLGTS